MHPADEIRGMKSSYLSDKRIVLAVTGSIAAVETIKLSRELIRNGAEVIPVMTSAATKIIHPDALWFATGKKPIIELSGETEHVKYCGNVKNPVDLLLISPCTANTISKIAKGIDDSAVTTFATTAIGAKHPIILVPAMHRSMYDHEVVQKNISSVMNLGINVIDPFFEKNKAKMASIEEITAQVIRTIGKKDLIDKKILIIGGSCSEPIDTVRSLSNTSSGKTAVALAKTAFFRGGLVELWYGTSPEQVPDYIEKKDFRTIDDVQNLIDTNDMSEFDIIIVCAALSDYIPEKADMKIHSDADSLSINCKKAEKIIPYIREKTERSFLIGFKLESEEKIVIEKAQALNKQYMLDFVVANTIATIESDSSEAWIIRGSKIIPVKDKKYVLADEIFNQCISK